MNNRIPEKRNIKAIVVQLFSGLRLSYVLFRKTNFENLQGQIDYKKPLHLRAPFHISCFMLIVLLVRDENMKLF